MTKKVKALLCASLLSVSCFGAATVLSLGAVNAETPVPEFQMHEGASLRLVTDSCGLRFMAELTEAKYQEMIDTTGETPVYKDGKSFGMLIAPTSYVQSAPEGTTDWVTYLSKKSINLAIPAEKVYRQAGASNYCFTGVLTNIQFNSANLDFIGIGYSCETDFYEYAEFTISDNSRNVAYVAGQALTDSTHDYGEANDAVLLDFLTDYLYRDAGVYAYEGGETTLYYDSLEDYDEDTDRTQGATDVVEVAKSLNYTLSYIDLQEEAEISLEAEDRTATLTVTSKVTGVDFSSLIEWSSSDSSVATVENGVVTAVGGGETTIKAKLFGQEYTSTVGVVTKYIASESDLTALCSADDVSGYYVLTSDIALSGTFAGITTGTFTGIFDGRGHSITGGKITYGLLGKKAEDATVRNLAMINVGISADPVETNKSNGGLLAYTMSGTATIENIYLRMNNPDEWAGGVGVWMRELVGNGAKNAILKAKNVVSYVDTDRKNMSAMMLVATYSNPTLSTLDNVHCGSQVEMVLLGYSSSDKYEPKQYTSQAAMQTAYANKTIDISWAKTFSFYNTLRKFLTNAQTYDLGAKDTLYLDSANAYTVAISENLASEDIESVKLNTTTISDYTYSDGTLTIPTSAYATLQGGEKCTLTVQSVVGHSYTAKLDVITKVINSEADLISLCATKDVSAYYVLGANITLTGEFAGITTGTFTGIFDGKGYSISADNMTNGLLGEKANNTTVRNLYLTGRIVSGNGKGALVNAFTGNSSVENVFVQLKKPNAYATMTAPIAYSVTGTLNAKNVISYFLEHWVNGATFVSWTTNKETQIIGENCHAGSGKGDLPNVVTTTGTCTGVENYTSLAAMQTAYANESIDISWAKTFSFYQELKTFLGA